MFFSESDTIADDLPHLRPLVESIDAHLHGAETVEREQIDPQSVAMHLAADERLVAQVFEAYLSRGAMRRRFRLFCDRGQGTTDAIDGPLTSAADLFCDVCARSHKFKPKDNVVSYAFLPVPAAGSQAESAHAPAEAGREQGMPRYRGKGRRAIILTAKSEECAAVTKHLSDIAEHTHPAGTIYEGGRFVAKSGTWDVFVAEIGQGNAASATEGERGIDYFDPEVAFFVGVAGGLKDVRLGDVVAAIKVFGYHAGKDTTGGFLQRSDIGRSSHALIQRARKEARDGRWLRRIPGVAPLRSPRAIVAPIAAGEGVVASRRSATCRFLKSAYSEAVAVEMEGRGFLEAAYANVPIQAIVIRGISDLLNKKTQADASGSQTLASRHAAAFAFEVLSNFRVPVKKARRRPRRP